jgi:hypothetical protein
MTMESRPAVDGEPRSPRDGGEFETSKESKKRRRKERRADRERVHAALEPLTIWVRTDPNRLQHPEGPAKGIAEKSKKEIRENLIPKVEAEPHKSAAKIEQESIEVGAAPEPARQERAQVKAVKAEDLTLKIEETVTIPEPEVPKPDPRQEAAVPTSVQEMPVFQDLPQLEIRPRHFYTEPEVRQPGTTEIEHDILPSLDGSSEAKQEAAQPEPEVEIVRAEKLPTTAERLQRLAEEKARRAEELELKNLEAQEPIEAQPVRSREEMNKHVRAIMDAKPESNISMEMGELLEIAESVRVEGVSVAEMYRSERIDEEGLRRIISDFLRGQRIERVVTDEILRQQMRFERDPQMRQIPLSVAQQNGPTSQMQAIRGQQRKVLTAKTMRHQADRIADRLAEGIDRTVEAAENNPNIFKTFGTVIAVIAYFVVLILIIRS